MDFQPRLKSLILRGEGSVDHMYLCSAGKVTIGVGNMLPNAEAAGKLPFHFRQDNNRANINLITDEFILISKQEKGKKAKYYEKFCHLYLPHEEILKLLDHRLDEFGKRLRMDFPGFDNFPDNAKLGLFDMAFNLGNHGLVNKFRNFTRAARSQDWSTCATECKRNGISDSRNQEVRELFEACV